MKKKTRKEKRKLQTKRYHWDDMITESIKFNKDEGYPTDISDIIADIQDVAFDEDQPWSLRISLYSILFHYTSGQQTFDLSDKIFQMFLRTDVQNVLPRDIQLPYKCLYVAFPKEYIIRVKNQKNIFQDHTCKGIYLFNTTAGNHKHIYVSIPAIPKSGPILNGTDHMYGMGLSSCMSLPHTSENDPDKSFDLHQLICKYLGTFLNKNDHENNKTLDSVIEIISIAFNTIIYLNHGLKTKLVQKQDSQQIEKYKSYKETTRSSKEKLKCNKIITRLSIANVTTLHPNSKGLKLQEMTATDILVRGHWHIYWTGKGRANRKVNWIQPHIRNKTDTKLDEIQARQYSI